MFCPFCTCLQQRDRLYLEEPRPKGNVARRKSCSMEGVRHPYLVDEASGRSASRAPHEWQEVFCSISFVRGSHEPTCHRVLTKHVSISATVPTATAALITLYCFLPRSPGNATYTYLCSLFLLYVLATTGSPVLCLTTNVADLRDT